MATRRTMAPAKFTRLDELGPRIIGANHPGAVVGGAVVDDPNLSRP